MHYIEVESHRFDELAIASDGKIYDHFRTVYGLVAKKKELPGHLRHNCYRVTKQRSAVILHLFNDAAEVARFAIRAREFNQAAVQTPGQSQRGIGG
jgi:hypothetical protein